MGAIGAVVEVAVWWALCVGVWDVTLSGTTGQELVVATAAGLPCAVAAAVARRVVRGAWRVDPRWVRWLPTLAISIVADAWRLLAAAVVHAPSRRMPGHFLDVPLHEPRAGNRAGHLALATLVVSSTPGTFVVDTDPAGHRLTLHSVTSGRPDLAGTVTR
jgi:multisubunit Na+/H+ antiporter MnhE subunit